MVQVREGAGVTQLQPDPWIRQTTAGELDVGLGQVDAHDCG